MSRFNRILAALLATAIVISLSAGCGAPPGAGSQPSGPPVQPPAPESSPTVPQETPATGEKLYDTTEFYSTVAEYQTATGKTIASYSEAPELAKQVAEGKLPKVEERVSSEPMVVVPLESVGKYGGRLRSAATSPVTGSAETWTARTQPLLIVSSDLQQVVPNIAKDFKFNSDYTELTLYLREGMKWSDGQPFTADDFAFFYEYILKSDEILPSKPNTFISGGELMGFTKVSDYELKYTFAQPNPSIISEMTRMNRMYLQVPYAPAHYLKQYLPLFNSDADKVAKDAGYENWLKYFLYIYPDEVQARWDTKLPSLDPWVLARTDEIGNKFFDRNPYYWKVDTQGNQLPYIDGQDRLLYDKATVDIKLLSGELDMGLQFTDAASYPVYKENEAKGDFRTAMWQDARGQVLADIQLNINHKDPAKKEIFGDLRFREALSVAINRDDINSVIWKGMATPRASTVSPSVSFYEDWMGEYMIQYDPGLANKKLDEMGLKWDDKKQYRLRSDGQPVDINLEYVATEGNVSLIAELLKKYWDAIGIKTSIKQIDQSLFDTKYQSGELDIYMWNLDGTTEFGFHGNPFLLYPHIARDWEKYMKSEGKDGSVPTDEFKTYYDKAIAFKATAIGTDEYKKLGKELLELSLKNMWHIGVAGLTPKPMIVKNSLKNTPSKGVYDYDYRYWMIFHPEQWYWEQ